MAVSEVHPRPTPDWLVTMQIAIPSRRRRAMLDAAPGIKRTWSGWDTWPSTLRLITPSLSRKAMGVLGVADLDPCAYAKARSMVGRAAASP